jgi:hypothetical protein
MGRATLCATFSQTHLVTLIAEPDDPAGNLSAIRDQDFSEGRLILGKKWGRHFRRIIVRCKKATLGGMTNHPSSGPHLARVDEKRMRCEEHKVHSDFIM